MDTQTHRDHFNHGGLQNAVPPPFPRQTHQALNQALGPHLQPVVRPSFQNSFRRLPSASPLNSPVLSQNGDILGSPQNHAGPPTRSPLHHQFSIPLPGGDHDSAAIELKRKHADGNVGNPAKRRREADDSADLFDGEGGPGAKHWTDDEKTKLFNWLMGKNEDDHWNSLRTAKNNALRECATEVFGNKKTYQALKGCYERNFNVFKQIYAFQTFSDRMGSIDAHTDGDRIREYERRLQEARKGGCEVGTLNARTIDHWHRSGWYNLFYQRWNGDPATTQRPVPRNSNNGQLRSIGTEDGAPEDEVSFEYPHSSGSSESRPHHVSQRAHSTNNSIPPESKAPSGGSGSNKTPDQPSLNVTLPENMIAACFQLLQTQSQQSAVKLEFMRKREEREEKDSQHRKEFERVRQEREAAEWELKKRTADVTQKSQLATELLANPAVDSSVKQAAGDYLKRLFAVD